MHLLLLTVHLDLDEPGSTPRMVLNGLRTPIASALLGLRVPVMSVRPAARLRPLNNAILVFMVADCYPDLTTSKTVTKLSLLSKLTRGNLGI